MPEKHKYLLAYLLSGESADYHRQLSGRLAQKFGIRDVSRRIDPHLTLKAPFHADWLELAEVEESLTEFVSSPRGGRLNLSGFGHFRRRVIYLAAEPAEPAEKTLSELMTVLEYMDWLPFARSDYRRQLHATLGYCLPSEHQRFKTFLEAEQPEFEVDFNSIALLEKLPRRWEVYREFPFAS